jgi:hypothetical protein
MVAVGLFLTLIEETGVVRVMLFNVTSHEKLPVVVMVIERVVSPFDHAYESPAVAVSVMLPPLQNVVGPEAVSTGLNVPDDPGAGFGIYP